MNDSTKLGELLKTTRLGQGLTQKQLAAKAGTNRTYVSRVENDAMDASISTLRKIAKPALAENWNWRSNFRSRYVFGHSGRSILRCVRSNI